jgi:hypothetical protein
MSSPPTNLPAVKLMAEWLAKRAMLLLLGSLWWMACRPAADAAQLSEYDVKAAFLFNFAKFIEWPPRAFVSGSAPLVIGVLGADPFGDSLRNTVKGQTVQGRPIEIRACQSEGETASCHVLFISRAEGERCRELLKAVVGRPILTIGEADDFLDLGGMINFVLVNRNVRFDINTKGLNGAGLKASSKLLTVARTVKD